MRSLGSILLTGLAIAFLSVPGTLGRNSSRAEDEPKAIDFDRDVKPIFAKHCVSCHGPEKPKSGLGSTARPTRSRRRPACDRPGKSAESLLFQLVAGHDKDRPMPPKGDACSRRDRDAEGLDRSRREVARRRLDRRTRPTGGRFKPFKKPSPPQIRNAKSEIRNDVDRFVLAKLSDNGLVAVARGRPAHADPPAVLRPDRPAADAGGSRRVRQERRRRTPTRSWSTGCSPRRTTASAGRGTGSTWSTTARRTATTRTSRGPTPGRIAITSSARSTTTSRTRASCRSRSPATCSSPARRTASRRSASSRPGRGTSSATPRCPSRRSTARSPGTSTATTWWRTRSARS